MIRSTYVHTVHCIQGTQCTVHYWATVLLYYSLYPICIQYCTMVVVPGCTVQLQSSTMNRSIYGTWTFRLVFVCRIQTDIQYIATRLASTVQYGYSTTDYTVPRCTPVSSAIFRYDVYSTPYSTCCGYVPAVFGIWPRECLVQMFFSSSPCTADSVLYVQYKRITFRTD